MHLFITSVTFPDWLVRSTLDPCPRNRLCGESSARSVSNPNRAAGARSSVFSASRRWAFVSAPTGCCTARPAARPATTTRWIGKGRRRTTRSPALARVPRGFTRNHSTLPKDFPLPRLQFWQRACRFSSTVFPPSAQAWMWSTWSSIPSSFAGLRPHLPSEAKRDVMTIFPRNCRFQRRICR